MIISKSNDSFLGGCKVKGGSEQSLTTAATLLGVEKDELRDSLISRVMQATKGGVKGTVIKLVEVLALHLVGDAFLIYYLCGNASLKLFYTVAFCITCNFVFEMQHTLLSTL